MTQIWLKSDFKVTQKWLKSDSKVTKKWLKSDSKVTQNKLRPKVTQKWVTSNSKVTWKWLKSDSQVTQKWLKSASKVTQNKFRPKVICPDRNSLSTVLTAVYMFISNLILLNILIAIFTDTYKNVSTNIRKVWTNGRYDVILEDYHYMPFGPIIGGILQFGLILWFLFCGIIRTLPYLVELIKSARSDLIKPIFFNKVSKYETLYYYSPFYSQAGGYWKSAFENEIFLVSTNFFSWILISKMDVKMNLRIITKNLAADSKKESSLKIDFRADWTHESIPTAW